MVTIYWLDITENSVIKLTLSGRVIYSAAEDDINRTIPPSSLRGRIVSPLSQDIIDIKYWAIFEDMEGSMRIAPIYERMIEEVIKNRSMFDQPVDIRFLYDYLSL